LNQPPREAVTASSRDEEFVCRLRADGDRFASKHTTAVQLCGERHAPVWFERDVSCGDRCREQALSAEHWSELDAHASVLGQVERTRHP